MNFNMELIGFTDVIITKMEKISDAIIFYIELPKKSHICPSCSNLTTKIHDYRIQKIKHLKCFERLTILYYKRRRYSCSCGKRFSEKNTFLNRFHYCRYIYWAMDEVRRKVQVDWDDYDRKKCKRMRHVFYKRQSLLKEEYMWYLKRYTEKSPVLKKAHELKELYCAWFDWAKTTTDMKEIKNRLYAFYREVEVADIPAFSKAIRTLKNWQVEILNSFSFGYSNGFLEGINNKTKVLKRNAFGFRRFEHFRAKILLNIRYKEIGVHLG